MIDERQREIASESKKRKKKPDRQREKAVRCKKIGIEAVNQ